MSNIEIGICENCLLYKRGCCYAENEPEKVTGCTTHCDYYLFNSEISSNYKTAFINGFVYCNKMKKQPVIERIEDRAKQEFVNKLIDYLRNEGFDV